MQSSALQPYLFFNGRCDEALAFYREALGAQVEFLMRYQDSPEPPPPGMLPPGFEHKVLHAQVRIGGTACFVSDGNRDHDAQFAGFMLSLTLPTAGDVDRAFAALADGGQVRMPLGKTFFSPRFGMVTDRFGVGWMLLLHAEH